MNANNLTPSGKKSIWKIIIGILFIVIVSISAFVGLQYFNKLNLHNEQNNIAGKTIAQETIKIGAVIAITGFGADIGQSEKNAIELLKEKYVTHNVEFFIEDSKSSVKDGITATKKLLEVNDVDVLYIDLTAIVGATTEIIKEKNRLLIAPVYLDDLTRNNELAIRNLPSAEQEINILINYLENNKIKSDKYAIFYSNDLFGKTTERIFKETVGKDHIVFSSAIIDENIKESALMAIQSHPDVVYIGSMSPNLGQLIREMRTFGFKGEFITTDAFSYPYINNIAGEYGKGVIYIDFDNTSVDYMSFATEYQNKFKTECVASAVICFDGLSMLIDNLLTHNNSKNFVNLPIKYKGIYGDIYLKNREIIYPIKALRWE